MSSTIGSHTRRIDAAGGGPAAPHQQRQPTRQAPGAAAPAVLQSHGLKKSYRRGKHVLHVLRGVDIHIPRGQFTAVVGQSGSGKTTLLHLLAALDAPDAGRIEFAGKRIDNLDARSRDRLRNRRFGMVFQSYHLLPELSAVENVLAPLMIAESLWGYWRKRKTFTQRAARLLEQVGLGERLQHKPRELSGGEMQRAAIARALVNQPEVLFADEPTGNLDQRTGEEVLALLRSLNRDQGLTIVMVTHNEALARQADATLLLERGRAVRAA